MSVQRPVAAPPEIDLAQAFSQGPRTVRRTWIVATTLGETAGFLVPALVAVFAFDLHPALTLLLMVSAGLVEGAVLGAAQSVVLRREFLGFSRASWIAATSVGAAAAWCLGMLPSTFYPAWTDWSPVLTVSLAVVLGLALLATIGFAQWLVLRHHLARSRTWVPANAVAWLLGLGVLMGIAMPLWREGQSTALVVAIGVLGGLAMAATVAVVTGLWLARLVRPRSGAAQVTRPVPPGVPEDDWTRLAQPTDRFRVFDPTQLEDLPDPVQRWMRHAIAPGATLLTGVDQEWNGHLRLGKTWRQFCSRQRATLDDGFVWSARTRLHGLPVAGFDRFTRQQGQMSWRILRRVRLSAESGDEVTRSSAGRLAAELLACVPSVALDPAVRWEPIDQGSAVAHITVGGKDQAVTVGVDPLGRLRQVSMDRWGTPPGWPFGNYHFGALLSEERRFDGYLVPTEVVAGWHFGTARWDEGMFLRYRVVSCSFH